jgi:hypothetical protein
MKLQRFFLLSDCNQIYNQDQSNFSDLTVRSWSSQGQNIKVGNYDIHGVAGYHELDH